MEFPPEKARGAPLARVAPTPKLPPRQRNTGLLWRIPVLALGLWLLAQYGQALFYDADGIFGRDETVVGSGEYLVDWDDVS